MTPVTLGPTARALSHWLRGPLAGLSWVVPLLWTLGRLSPASQWRDDVALVRGLGFLPIAGEGVVSSVAMQAASLLPIGGRLLRASIPSAIAAALAAGLLFHFCLKLLDKNVAAPRLSPALALVAAWASVLGPWWQREATVAGGASIAALLVLIAVWLRFQWRWHSRGWLAFGAATGAALLEQRLAGLACLVLLLADAALVKTLPTLRQLGLLLGGVALVLAVGLLPFLGQPASGGVWTDLGSELGRLSGSNGSAAPFRSTFAGWVDALGWLVLGVSAFGCVWGLLRPRTRPWLLPFLVLPLLELGLSHGNLNELGAVPSAPLSLLAVSVLLMGAALGLHTLGLALGRAQLPFAKAIQALLVVLSVCFVLITIDEADGHTLDSASAAEAWTDEAVGSLPPNSLVMVQSEPVAFRLWAARVVRGERPDLTLVPVPLLDRGDTARRLLVMEPHLGPLIRELRVSGKASEYALSSLADARPLYLELDPRWDQRLLEHVLPHPFWMRFAPHALGRSDRRATLKEGRDAFQRVLAAATNPTRDPATLSLLTSRARQQAVLLAALGDHESAGELLADLEKVPEAKGFVSAMQVRLSAHQRRIDFMDLLESPGDLAGRTRGELGSKLLE